MYVESSDRGQKKDAQLLTITETSLIEPLANLCPFFTITSRNSSLLTAPTPAVEKNFYGGHGMQSLETTQIQINFSRLPIPNLTGISQVLMIGLMRITATSFTCLIYITIIEYIIWYGIVYGSGREQTRLWLSYK